MPISVTHTNRLINEKSPYLLQHAHNPVDWYPWGDEAFAKAKAEDKPVFLSIGYSTCHWCHVMELESFEDEEVAKALNQSFVSIKVDREERPDVDAFYMDACVALNGNGGWPLSCFLTHDRKPFFAGTYFPKEDGLYGTGFLTVLSQIDGIWRRRRSDIVRSADEIAQHIGTEPKGTELKPDVIELAFWQLEKRFDDRYGGFGGAPKFPSLQNLLFLSLYGAEKRSQRALDMLRKTLDCMADGGIYDHVGGGFCRYSTDNRWLVPHFEKMMVDNALHILVYSQAAALFGGRYADVAKHTIDFCTREMLDRAGGFYTATDADSEGVEGKFYVFTPEEIEEALGESDGQRYCELYHIIPSGNFEGKNIPNLIDTGLPEADLAFARRCNEMLLQYRGRRVPPFRDEKVTAMVNGLMVAALAAAGRILGEQSYIDTARRCADFVLTQLVKNGRLMNRWRAGEAGIPGNSDDYACLIWGLTELYAATFEPRWLVQAVSLTDQMEALFWDKDNGGYYLTGSDVDDLPVRQKNMHDGALPSGNAIMALNLTRLSRLCANERYAAAANEIIKLAAPILNSQPAACCGLMPTLLYLENGGTDIILVNGEGLDALRACLPALAPFTSVAVCSADYEDILTAAPYLRDYKPVSGKAAAYVCKNGACGRPVTSPEKFKSLL